MDEKKQFELACELAEKATQEIESRVDLSSLSENDLLMKWYRWIGKFKFDNKLD